MASFCASLVDGGGLAKKLISSSIQIASRNKLLHEFMRDSGLLAYFPHIDVSENMSLEQREEVEHKAGDWLECLLFVFVCEIHEGYELGSNVQASPTLAFLLVFYLLCKAIQSGL